MPVWEALYVIVISSRTGWTEEFIRHGLPLARGLAYYHACRAMEGERCRWPGRPSAMARHVGEVLGWIRTRLKSTRTP